jgi:hypothetical protein
MQGEESSMKRLFVLTAGLAIVAAAVVVLAPGAAFGAKTKCPSSGTPAPGSKVNGGLELTNNSRVNGGITVNGGELDVNHQLSGASSTGTTSRVDGGITLNSPFDYDIWTATIHGPINVTGNSPFAAPEVCGNDISGGVTVSNSSSFGVFVGDPEDPPTFATEKCPGNTIHGGVAFTNVTGGSAVEGNTITGPVTLDNSKSELNGNTITGPVTCTNGGAVTPGEPPDPASNACS